MLFVFEFGGCPFKSAWLDGWNCFSMVWFGRGFLDWFDLGGCERGFVTMVVRY